MFPRQRQGCEFIRSGWMASLEPSSLISSLVVVLETFFGGTVWFKMGGERKEHR